MVKNNQRGSVTLEAALGLSVFIFAFVTLLSLGIYTTIENRTQYAIDQTAREISQYYYILARAGLITTSNEEAFKDLDQSISDALSLSNAITSGYANGEASLNSVSGDGTVTPESIDTMVNTLKTLPESAAAIGESGQALFADGQNLFKDPTSVIKALALTALKTAAASAISKMIAQPLCQSISEKYIATGTKSADDVLNDWGILTLTGEENGGMNGLYFGESTFLVDERSINVVLVYRVQSIIPSFFPNDHVVFQTASTAAWAQGRALT